MTNREKQQAAEIKLLRRAVKEGRIFGAAVAISSDLSPAMSSQWRKFAKLSEKAYELEQKARP